MADRPGRRGIDGGATGDLRVLVIDTAPDGGQQTVRVLREHGCDCRVTTVADSPVQTAIALRPDAIVLDSCVVEGAGPALLHRLKADHRTALVPVICVAGDDSSDAVLEMLSAGADDYVAKPFRPKELLARIVGAARRRALLGGVSPLTGLPGNLLLTRELQARLDRDEEFAFLHVDLDNFKAFNDRYGYVLGDRVIAETAQMLHAQVDEQHVSAVLGHIGGDDFGIVTTPEAAVPLAEAVAAAFDALALGFYGRQERERGSVFVETRAGGQVEVPLMSVSIGVALRRSGHASSTTAIADAASEMKSVAKQHRGSYVAVDRRGG